MTKFWALEQIFSCRHLNAELCRFPQTVGPDRYAMWCFDCRHQVSKEKGYPGVWISKEHPDFVGINLEQLKVPYENRVYRRCEGPCNKLALCELHHFGPKKFFGDDEAEEWPMAFLCHDCHMRWHQIVTPALCTAYSADAHFAQITSCLKHEQVVALARLLYKHCKERAA